MRPTPEQLALISRLRDGVDVIRGAAGSGKTTTALLRLTDKAIRSGFDPKIIGIDLLSFAERPNGIELAIAYTAIIVKARAARLRANKN